MNICKVQNKNDRFQQKITAVKVTDVPQRAIKLHRFRHCIIYENNHIQIAIMLVSGETCGLQDQFAWYNYHGPLLLTSFNLNTSMDK